ncbi:hypothetical protein [Scytonema sp. PRP1]|uniref:hypothetical protein n=1 Tax=Scytonema sp. PRP1 TaxID=3120513 RepID=UPI003FA6EC85
MCIGDGDNIGDVIDFYLLSQNLEEASKFSFQVKAAMKVFASRFGKQKLVKPDQFLNCGME